MWDWVGLESGLGPSEARKKVLPLYNIKQRFLRGPVRGPPNLLTKLSRPAFYPGKFAASCRKRSVYSFMNVVSDKTKYMIMSQDQNAGRSHSMKTDNSSIERVEQFKYLGPTLTNKILFRRKLRAD